MLTIALATGIVGGEVVVTPPDTLLSDFRMRYPEFEATPDVRVQYWLDDSSRFVEESTYGSDYDLAQMLYAAHNLATQGFGTAAETANLPAGITQMKSGTLSLSFDSATVKAQMAGGWNATKYGAQYLQLLKLKKAGNRITNAGTVPACGYGYRTSLLGGYYGG